MNIDNYDHIKEMAEDGRSLDKFDQFKSLPPHIAGWVTKHYKKGIEKLNEDKWSLVFLGDKIDFAFTNINDKIIGFGLKDMYIETPWFVSGIGHEMCHALFPTERWNKLNKELCTNPSHKYTIDELIQALHAEETKAYTAQLTLLSRFPNGWYKNAQYSKIRRNMLRELGIDKCAFLFAYANVFLEVCQRLNIPWEEFPYRLILTPKTRDKKLFTLDNIDEVWSWISKERGEDLKCGT